jgi:malonyl-CoA decarboxylase
MTPQQQLSQRTASFGRMIGSVVDAGRGILAKRRQTQQAGSGELLTLCNDLLEHRGEASGLALASEICERLETLSPDAAEAFFGSLAQDFDVVPEQLIASAQRYSEAPDFEALATLKRAAEAPREKLFRRLNMSPGGTSILVNLRGQLLAKLRQDPSLRGVDADLKHLFISWFNQGFLELRRIDWNSPALVLERIINYEAVHAISGWDDLRSRLQSDRLCFAFFHPALPDDPLVFVEVALTQGTPDAIAPLLDQQRQPIANELADTVVFYSISNCHPGLAGVSFGNFLIKHVVAELKQALPGVKTFVTLSPVPGFRRWLTTADLSELIDTDLATKVCEPLTGVVTAEVRDALIHLCAHYLINVKAGPAGDTAAGDPVARFHLGNGARLHRLNWGADLSAKGKQQSAGIMVNYLYDLDKIEQNHDAYFDQGEISVSKTISKLL